MKSLALSISLALLLLTSCRQAGQPDGADPPPQAVAANQNRSRPCVNLNQASAAELEALPGIGEVMAQKMIEYRERHKGFRRPQEVIVIDGFSEKKYRAIADLVCVE